MKVTIQCDYLSVNASGEVLPLGLEFLICNMHIIMNNMHLPTTRSLIGSMIALKKKIQLLV